MRVVGILSLSLKIGLKNMPLVNNHLLRYV